MSGDLEKLAKLLRVACSTGPDGEKLAALNRLSAIAAAHDLDWDRVLANGSAITLSEEQLQKVFDAGYERCRQDNAAPETPDWSPASPPPRSLDYINRVIAAAQKAENYCALNDWEETFCGSIRQKIARFGSRSMMSEKQWDCIERLAEKLERLGYLEW